jgi:pyridinium-3,5-bisthiocarboxylic acid mononucleotide nickel chelatase
MKIAYFDCFAGVSGDMTLGALIDLGLDPGWLADELRKLPLEGYRLETRKVSKRGLQAVQFCVILGDPAGEHLADSEYVEIDQPQTGDPAVNATAQPNDQEHNQRSLSEILALIQNSQLSERVKGTACRIFTRLGEAESHVHGQPLEQVHFHEVGAVDAILDIVGTAIALEGLGIEEIFASPLPLGSGFVRSQHGLLPVPAPATAYLITGVPAYSSEVRGELVTPTGAAILTSLAKGFGPMPLMSLQAVGYGAGSRERDFPNTLRIFLGEAASMPQQPQPAEPGSRLRDPHPEQHRAPAGPAGYHESPALVLEATIDDMEPELFEALTEKLLSAGALDVLLIPVQMKKSRPGLILHVLAYPPSLDELLKIIFTESTSIGVRTYEVTKHMLQREIVLVKTPYGPVHIKLARLGATIVNVKPEYEDCRELARQMNIPLKTVLEMARQTAWQILEERPAQADG